MTAMEGAKAIHNEYPVIFMDCDLMFTSEQLYEYYCSDDYDSAGTLLTFRSDKDRYSYVETGEDHEIAETVNTVKVADGSHCGEEGHKREGHSRAPTASSILRIPEGLRRST